ncbi:MAG TPA: hypothetical protein VKD72_32665 [Gemmataceae bacterium]|nr:hypothetical protein [Gemmataceae bacterium]
MTELVADIRRELGSDFEMINRQQEIREDPDLDAYLADPIGFRRRRSGEQNHVEQSALADRPSD